MASIYGVTLGNISESDPSLWYFACLSAALLLGTLYKCFMLCRNTFLMLLCKLQMGRWHVCMTLDTVQNLAFKKQKHLRALFHAPPKTCQCFVYFSPFYLLNAFRAGKHWRSCVHPTLLDQRLINVNSLGYFYSPEL